MKIVNGVLAVCLLMLLPVCEWFVSSKKATEFVIVNVLDKELYDDCHIKGSIQVDYMALQDYALKYFDKETTNIVIHCSNYKCTASGEGTRLLNKLGFKHVWAYEPGTAEAKKQGIPMVGVCKQDYLNDFEKPEGYNELHKDASFVLLTTEELQQMMKRFALNEQK